MSPSRSSSPGGSPSALIGKCREYFTLRWGLQHVTFCKLPRLRILRGPNALRSFRQIVRRVPQLNVRSEQEPIGTRLSKRHSHTAGVHNSNSFDPPVKLH